MKVEIKRNFGISYLARQSVVSELETEFYVGCLLSGIMFRIRVRVGVNGPEDEYHGTCHQQPIDYFDTVNHGLDHSCE